VPTSVCFYTPATFLIGGNPAGGVYSGPGVNSANGLFTAGWGLQGYQDIKYEVTSANGCKNAAYDSIFVSLCDGVNTLSEKMEVSIQPNPTNGLFEVNVTNLKSEASLSIYNDLGQQVYSRNLSPAAGTDLKLDLSNEPSGLYFLMLNCKGNIQVDKIILK
jgi:hypothetical protein